MALTTGNAASWSDIEALFTSLNSARTKYGKSSISAGVTQGDRIAQGTISTLASGVTDLASVGNLSQYAVISGTIPSVGDLINPTYLNNIRTSISNITTCSGYNASQVSYNSSNFTSDNTYNSSNFTSDHSYNSSNFTNDDSYNSSYFSSNNGHRSSHFSSNNGHRSSHFSSNNGHRASSYSFYYTGEVYSYKTSQGY